MLVPLHVCTHTYEVLVCACACVSVCVCFHVCVHSYVAHVCMHLSHAFIIINLKSFPIWWWTWHDLKLCTRDLPQHFPTYSPPGRDSPTLIITWYRTHLLWSHAFTCPVLEMRRDYPTSVWRRLLGWSHCNTCGRIIPKEPVVDQVWSNCASRSPDGGMPSWRWLRFSQGRSVQNW